MQLSRAGRRQTLCFPSLPLTFLPRPIPFYLFDEPPRNPFACSHSALLSLPVGRSGRCLPTPCRRRFVTRLSLSLVRFGGTPLCGNAGLVHTCWCILRVQHAQRGAESGESGARESALLARWLLSSTLTSSSSQGSTGCAPWRLALRVLRPSRLRGSASWRIRRWVRCESGCRSLRLARLTRTPRSPTSSIK
mgnify:CR=1 FL=1